MKAFSLLEVLIAAALLGLMGVILFSSLESSLDVTDRAQTISNRNNLMRQALARMAGELSMAYVSNNRNPAALVVDTQFKGEKDSVSYVAFGGLQHRLDAKESGEREIGYFLKDGKLMRREKSNPGKELFTSGKERLVCPDVHKLEFKYWNPVTSAWDSEWKTQGRAIAEAKLPPRVQIELTFKEKDDELVKVTTESEIWLTDPIFLVKSQ